MKIRLLTASLLWGCAPGSPPNPPNPADQIASDIAFLADDAREGRGVGTEGLIAAAGYIARRFDEAGLEPAGDSGFFQPFTISATAPAAAHAGLGGEAVTNVVGILPGSGALASQAVVVGAHYDHLGLGGFGSLDPDSVAVVHNGADDNASGTAVMIGAARILATRAAANHRALIFIAFTAEELGLIGSEYHVQNPVATAVQTFAMINLDMVGRLTENRLAAFGAETATEFPALLEAVNTTYGFDIAASGDGFGRSDQQSFYAAKIPVLHFFTGTHAEYHRTSDDSELINVPGATRIASLVADLSWQLATRIEPLTFVDAVAPQLTTAGGYGAYLGTIPDMTESPGGVRLSGVRAGSPAEDAGLQAGDILIGIGDFEVTDLYKMTDALRSYRPGDTVTLLVQRGSQVLELPATFGRRGG